MKKSVWIIILLLFAFCFQVCGVVAQEIINKEEGSFEIVESNYDIRGAAINLGNGNVLIYNTSNFLKFDSNTNEIKPLILRDKKNRSLDLGYTNYGASRPALKLDNENILFVAPYISHPDLYSIPIDLHSKSEKKYVKRLKRKSEFLYNKYTNAIQEYEDSGYVQIYNINKNELIKAGELSIRRRFVLPVKAENGKIYLFGGKAAGWELGYNVTPEKAEDYQIEQGQKVEMYDPVTRTSKIVGKYPNKLYSVKDFDVVPVAKNKLLLVKNNTYVLFDTDTNSFSDKETIFNSEGYFFDFMTKLPNGEVLLGLRRDNRVCHTGEDEIGKKLSQNNDFMEKFYSLHSYRRDYYTLNLYKYDKKDNVFRLVNNVIVARIDYNINSSIVIMQDGRLLIMNGEFYKNKFIGDKPSQGVIYNPVTNAISYMPDLPIKLSDRVDLTTMDNGKILIFETIKCNEIGRECRPFEHQRILIIYTPQK